MFSPSFFFGFFLLFQRFSYLHLQLFSTSSLSPAKEESRRLSLCYGGSVSGAGFLSVTAALLSLASSLSPPSYLSRRSSLSLWPLVLLSRLKLLLSHRILTLSRRILTLSLAGSSHSFSRWKIPPSRLNRHLSRLNRHLSHRKLLLAASLLPHGCRSKTDMSQSQRRRGTFVPIQLPQLPNSIPPGATPMAATSLGMSTTSGGGSSRVSLHELMNAPSRRNQPHLHPDKEGGALWFKIDGTIVNKYVRTIWQNNFRGPWANWSMVPQYKKDEWWADFVQHFYWEPRHHEQVQQKWKQECMESICERISTKKRERKKPDYIGDEDWETLLKLWSTESAMKKSRINAQNRKSEAGGFPMHKHSAGPVSFASVEYKMRLEAGGDDPISYTEIVRKTHTRKDGTFVDRRPETIVSEVEQAATQISASDISSGSSLSTPSSRDLNKAYLEYVQPRKGRYYGLGSVQDLNGVPAHTPASTLPHNLDVDVRLTDVESNVNTVKEDVKRVEEKVATVMEALVDVKGGMAAILRHLGISQDNLPHSPRQSTESVRASNTPRRPSNQDNIEEWGMF